MTIVKSFEIKIRPIWLVLNHNNNKKIHSLYKSAADHDNISKSRIIPILSFLEVSRLNRIVLERYRALSRLPEPFFVPPLRHKIFRCNNVNFMKNLNTYLDGQFLARQRCSTGHKVLSTEWSYNDGPLTRWYP